jgi:hypothetical protein
MVTVDRVTESDLDGFAVLEVYGEGKIRRFCNGDPSVRAGLIRFEISPPTGPHRCVRGNLGGTRLTTVFHSSPSEPCTLPSRNDQTNLVMRIFEVLDPATCR